ncbi:uncharacterized protein EI97DRAFT_431699 [Westerdykella ornata]|uniref:Uncharacterized protein n=1 Tax=Westerdykella ornata TaxID=318751 RepID=A0A6A6JPD4_WESOR|nr:uncharacterized protein EI97DRAFT_431699 [Westerdykella ornata]KAF2278481.1 hypothetical protein EI97DRAFT_431699 [Westerdykella ornata]
MATLRSLGLHTPAALQYLIDESVLHEDSTERDYTWDTYDDDSPDGSTDELVTTEYHVVWSRGGVVRKCFNFEVENERVIQALLTWFPTEEPVTVVDDATDNEELKLSQLNQSFLSQGTQPATDPNAPSTERPKIVEGRARALVVLLKSQAHVFFLSGTTHIAHLPFEVERAFPAARGVILQRKIAPRPGPPAKSIPSSVPPGSFSNNSQGFIPQSLSQSFSQIYSQPDARQASLGSLRTPNGRKSGSTNARFLDQLAKSLAFPSTDGLPRLYSFTDPLSEFGLVVNVVTANERAGFFVNGSGHRRLEPIDQNEEVLYVSPQNEIYFDKTGNDKPLLFVVTSNSESNTITIWSAAYLEPKSVSASRKQHFAHPTSKARRRSSYGPSTPGTPAILGTDRLRDSLGGAPRRKVRHSGIKPSQLKEKLSDQAVEDALASQLNPELERAQHSKESRRVSSLLSRAELSTSFDRSAFQDLATQRTSLGGSFGASFGASQRSRRSLGYDRTSFGGFSRHRASTPGSIASRMSVGGTSFDDTLNDIMDEDTFDTLEDYDELDDLFSPPDAGFEQEALHGLRKELVISPITEISVQEYLQPGFSTLKDATGNLGTTQQGSARPTAKVFSVAAPFNSATLHERKMFIYIKHPALQHPLECELSVMRKRLSAAASQTRLTDPPRYACVPKMIKVETMRESSDVVKVVDGQVARAASLISLKSDGPCLSLHASWGAHLPMKLYLGPLRLFDPHAVMRSEKMRATAGSSRTISPHLPLRGLLSPGKAGTFDIMDGEFNRHRLQLKLSPAHPFVAHLFQALTTILPNYAGELLLEIYWNIQKIFTGSAESKYNIDWLAFVTTLFTLATPFIDNHTIKPLNGGEKTEKRRSRRLSSHARPDEHLETDESAWAAMCSRQDGRMQIKSWQSTPWAWIMQAQPSSNIMNPPSRTRNARILPAIEQQIKGNRGLLIRCAHYAREFDRTPIGKAASDHWRRLSFSEKQDLRISCLSEIVVILHLVREERKLDIMTQDFSTSEAYNLAPVLAQLGHWLRWESWGFAEGSYFDVDAGLGKDWSYEDSSFTSTIRLHSQPWDVPPSILEWLCTMLRSQSYYPFPTLARLIRKSKASPHSSVNIDEIIQGVTPRTVALQNFFQEIDKFTTPRRVVELMARCGIDSVMLETLPEAARAPLMEALTRCQANPPTTWSGSLLKLVQREDLDLAAKANSNTNRDVQLHQSHATTNVHSNLHSSGGNRDIHTICQTADDIEPAQSSAEIERHVITRMIFKEDRRFMEAYHLLEPLRPAVAEYRPSARQDEAATLEGQKALMQWVMVRTFSLPVGNSMIKLGSKRPLLTAAFPLYGFSTSCTMKPMGNVVTADRASYSEEKFVWAFFNAGVAAGLSIARDAQGIDTSWFSYNKPPEPTNKHAGLLLGLGLNGHLKNTQKYMAFNYLLPRHTMTSVATLLGLAASYMGTMDTLVTRLLSVHITRMIPHDAFQLPLSGHTETAGLMAIGILYFDTQHRRMSEIMLSELEHVQETDPFAESPDKLRNEAYRLAAGFALGYINIGKGNDLRGLHDMRILERLMTVAVAPKPVHLVHILDEATAGAVIAITLIYMKTNKESVARKIDVPDTLPQFDYVRSDIFLLRTLARHMIMWDGIVADSDWIIKNLPLPYRPDYDLKNIKKLRSQQMPFFNILAGLLWSISLRYAGTGDRHVRDFLLHYLDQFIRIHRLPALRYDSKLTRNTVRNCQDLMALATATVVAGTGDLEVLRRCRALHGRLGPDAPYGSHLAGHMAFGILFMGGGTHTFATSNKAIASLICAFYPLFPTEVKDSEVHLQAWRHFWVLAAEPRCLYVRDVDTGRIMSMPIILHLKDDPNPKHIEAPCLLPELHTIARLETDNVAYWPTTLDFENNPLHFKTFKQNQTIMVRRRSAHDMYASPFSNTLMALNDAHQSRASRQMWDWLFSLPSLASFESSGADAKSDMALILPVDPHSSTFLDMRSTVVDHRLVLRRAAGSWSRRDLMELRGVFEWAEGMERNGEGGLRWLGREVVERLKAGVLERGRRVGGDGGGV